MSVNKIFKYSLFLFFSVLGYSQDSGIYDAYVILNSNGNGNSYHHLVNVDGFNNSDLGVFNCTSSLVLKGAQNKVWKCYDGNDITNGELHYRIYPTSSTTPPGFSTIGLGWVNDDHNAACNGNGANQIWETNSSSINVLSGLQTGIYYIEVYTTANYTYSGNPGTHYWSNSGVNFKAIFTVHDSDSDGDGYCANTEDCDDNNETVNPGAIEINFNGIDDDCNPDTLDANSGIFESYVIINNNYYDLQASTVNPDFDGSNLGYVTCGDNLTLSGAQNKIFKCDTGDIVNGKLFYRVYESSSSPGGFVELNLNWFSNDYGATNDCQNQTWETSSHNINLLSNLTPGNYILEVYTSADYTSYPNPGTHYVNNSGANYLASFTYYDEAPEAICQDITVQLDANGQASIAAVTIDNGSNDTCGIASMTIDKDTFDCSDISPEGSATPSVWINEIHYDNNGGDVNESIEVTANFDASDYTVVLYNGSSGTTYGSVLNLGIDFTLTTNAGYNFYTIILPVNGLQNGSPDGLALVDDANSVVEFISYEGVITATNGPAIGLTSTNIGVSEVSSTPSGYSLQKIGTGSQGPDFYWTSPQSATLGAFNNGQTLLSEPSSGVNVTLTVTDNNGNVSTCTANVTVEDHIAPNVICQDLTVQLDANGQASIVAADIDGGSSDACGIASMAIDKDTFDCSDIGSVGSSASSAWINEIHYDNDGGDVGEFIEIAGTAGINLSNYQLVAYDADNLEDSSVTLSGIIPDEGNGYGAIAFFLSHLNSQFFENGPSEGRALIETGVGVVDFISYEGTVTAANGLANGAVSTDIGSETNSTLQGQSLQRTDNGWTGPTEDSPGSLNVGQNLSAGLATKVTLTVTDNNGNVSTCTANVTVVDNIAPSITCPIEDIVVNTDPGSCTAIVTYALDYSDNCSMIIEQTEGLASGSEFPVGTTTNTFVVTDLSGNNKTCSFDVVVDNIQTNTQVTITPNPQQYSDQVTFTATIQPGEYYGISAAQTATFFAGTQNMGTVNLILSGDVLTASLTKELLENPLFNGQMAPGNHTVTATFGGIDPSFIVEDATTTLTIDQENAEVEYTGQTIQATPSSNDSQTTVVLSSTIQDIDDAFRGDIRNAQVKFVDRDSGNDISGWIPVSNLIDSANTTTGTVSYNWLVDIGIQDSESYTVGIVVDNGYYIRNNANDNTVITVYIPVGDFITGGGYIVPTNSVGQYGSTPGLKTNFGFNVKYNKKGKKLLGKMNVIFRRLENDGIHVYQIKSNSVQSLGVNTMPNLSNPNEKVATFISKSNLTDITDPLNPQSVGGNLNLKVDMTDMGEPGQNDRIAFTLTDNVTGTLLYSSEWNGLSTEEVNLSGGNVVVQSGFSLDSGSFSKQTMLPTTPLTLDVFAYPNPFKDHITLTIKSASVNGEAMVKVYDLYGKLLLDKEITTNRSIQFGNKLTAGMYIVCVKIGDISKTIRLIKK